MPAKYEISIRRQDSMDAAEGRGQGHRVVLTATVVRGFHDAGVFVSRQRGAGLDFTNVATPADLVDLDLNNPDEDGRLRSDTLDLTFASRLTADEVVEELLEELQVLCDELARINDTLTETSVISIRSDLQE